MVLISTLLKLWLRHNLINRLYLREAKCVSNSINKLELDKKSNRDEAVIWSHKLIADKDNIYLLASEILWKARNKCSAHDIENNWADRIIFLKEKLVTCTGES